MIDSLHIAGFKLFRDLTVPKLGRMNLFVGENNTGKSCLLEAIGLYAGRNSIVDVLQTASLRSAEPLRPWEAGGWNEEGIALKHPVIDLLYRKESALYLLHRPIVIETRSGDPNSLNIRFQLHDVVVDEEGRRRYVPTIPGHVSVGSSEIAIRVSRGIKQVALITRQHLPLRLSTPDLGTLGDGQAVMFAHLPASGFSDEKAASLWDQLIQGPDQDRVLYWMSLIDSRIQALDYIGGGGTSRIPILKVQGEGRIPLTSMGDGLRRMFHIGLAAATASKGVLLIDEFENGLHWRVQRELWAALAKAAKEFDVQIFATTHSRDCIGGFVSASQELGIKDATLYRMEREGDEIYAVNLALINVEDALEVNGEVR
jgi:AAA domain, putative AbiEii toxin, Type IV TA system